MENIVRAMEFDRENNKPPALSAMIVEAEIVPEEKALTKDT